MNRVLYPRVFFDASCLFAAAGSPTGGSSLILLDRKQSPVVIVIAPRVIEEVEKNLREVKAETALARFEQFKNSGVFEIWESEGPADISADSEVPAWHSIVNEKDLHVVRYALESGCQHIITLDRALIREITAARIDIQIWTPGDFINGYLRVNTSK